MNSGTQVFRELILRKLNNLQDFFSIKKMFQGPKGYKAQRCEVHLQYGNSTTK